MFDFVRQEGKGIVSLPCQMFITIEAPIARKIEVEDNT
jgi:hypothetical protein